MTTLGSDMIFYHTADQDATTIYLVSLVIAYLLYPLLGWMADVYFTRYSFVRASFISTIAAMGLLIMSGILFLTSPERLYFLLSGFSIIICLIGLGLFESTAIQFGMDQMLEASSEQLSTFIHWYYWSCYLGQLMIFYLMLGILAYFSDCSLQLEPTENLSRKLHSYEFVITCTILIACAVIQLLSACCGLGLLIGFKRHLNIDRTGDHPLKLIYQVLKYMPGSTRSLSIAVPSPTGRRIFHLVLTWGSTSMEDHSPLRRWRTPRHSYAYSFYFCLCLAFISQDMATLC